MPENAASEDATPAQSSPMTEHSSKTQGSAIPNHKATHSDRREAITVTDCPRS